MSFTVRYFETDQMGVMHHSNYARWFEVARIEFLRAHGLSYAQFEALGVYSPVIELQTRFIRPVRFDETAIVEMWIRDASPARFSVGYRVTGADGGLIATARSEHCYVNTNFRPASLKKAAPAIFDKMLALVELEAAEKFP